MVHHNTHITIVVKKILLETPGYRSIIFNRPIGFHYSSGDWIDIQCNNQILKGGITYSLSSSPTEPDLMITFKDGVSEMKKQLATIKPGAEVTIIQYGNDYKFTLKPNKPSMLIAGGVGIAPFRSMVREMVSLGSKDIVTLIYLHQTPEFIFKNEFDSWRRDLPGLNITYIVTSELKMKDRKKAILSAISSPHRSFYIAGPEGMVETTEHLLIDSGVDINDIKIDSFSGY